MYYGAMTESPPALTDLPQFSADYWRKVERLLTAAQIVRITNLPVEPGDVQWVEIVIGNNLAFRRRKSDIAQFLHANQKVMIENIGGQICTGLLVPDVGWAWRMTAEDLASHAREMATMQYQRAQEIRAAVLDYVATALTDSLEEQAEVETGSGGGVVIIGPIDITRLAVAALTAMETIGKDMTP